MKRILIVDDEPHVIRVMRLSLERNGYEVFTAANGEIALQWLADNTPDVMLTDIDMPRMTGEQLCKEINHSMPERTFRIIVLTARAELEHRQWSASYPNMDFMEKPVSIRKLIARLEAYFSQCIDDDNQERRLTAQ